MSKEQGSEPVPVPSADEIPEEFVSRKQWLMWDNSHNTPRQPHWKGDFKGITWSDPADWHTFEEAAEAAKERDSWGIGYVMAADNDDHTPGVYGCVDIDGAYVERYVSDDPIECPCGEKAHRGITGDGSAVYACPGCGKQGRVASTGKGADVEWKDGGVETAKEVFEQENHVEKRFELRDWVPDLSPFTDGLTYIEYSPSGNGLHIPIVAADVPEWWADCQIDDHQGVDVLTNKFCTFTGDTHPDSGSGLAGVDPTSFLFEAHQNIKGEAPRIGETQSASLDDYSSDDEWLEPSDVEDALNNISPDLEYPEWLKIAFAVHDFDSTAKGRSIFESWSRGGSKWDSDAERTVEHVWSNASAGSGVTVATLVHKAKQAGWTPPRSKSRNGSGTATGDSSPTDTSTLKPSGGYLSPDAFRVYAGLDEETKIRDLDDRAKAAYVWMLVKESDEAHVRVNRDNDELWGYNTEKGIWEPNGERVLRHAARKALMPVNYGGNVLEELKNQARADPEAEIWNDEFGLEPGKVAVKNGLLDLEEAYNGNTDDALRELEPEDYALTRLTVDYDPDADGSTWKPFVGEVVESSMIQTVQEYIGYCLHRENLYERALLLVGGGENGKTTFLNTISEFLGDDNVTDVSPFDFGEKTSLARMHGGLANMSVELEGGSLQGKNLANFKNLTGGDRIEAKRLYKDPFSFTYSGGMLFATNEVPAVPVSDDDTAFWRRWIIVHFDNQFPEGSDKRDPTLGKRLKEPENLSAVLNWAIEGWGRLMESEGFDNVPPTPDETRRKWQSWGDSVDYFLSNVAERDPNAPNISTSEGWEVYRAWCQEKGHDFVGQSKFTNAAKDSNLGYKSSVRTDRKAHPVRGYKNFGTADEVPDPIEIIEGESDAYGDNDDDRDDGHNSGLDTFDGDGDTDAELEYDESDENGARDDSGSNATDAPQDENGAADASETAGSDPEPPTGPFDDAQCRNCGTHWNFDPDNPKKECSDCETPVDWEWNAETGRVPAEKAPLGDSDDETAVETAATGDAFELPDADATGPLPDARRLYAILEENSGRMSRSDLFGRAAKVYDMAPDDAERALEKGCKKGLLTDVGGDTIESV